MRKLGYVAAGFVVAFASASCGQAAVSSDDAAFRGLPSASVDEALNLPYVERLLESEPKDTQRSLAQGAVRNMIFCRDKYRAYEEWMSSGQAPQLAPLIAVETPLEPSSSAMETDWERAHTALESGDISQLRTSLTQNGSCGQWVPSVPGDASSPTIADAIAATG